MHNPGLKNKELHYGYKNPTKVDAKNKLVISYTTEVANVHDSVELKKLVDKKDKTLLADAAYPSEENQKYLLVDYDCDEFMQIKAKQKRFLTNKEKQMNKHRSHIRLRIEYIFARMSQMGMGRLRITGLPISTTLLAIWSIIWIVMHTCSSRAKLSLIRSLTLARELKLKAKAQKVAMKSQNYAIFSKSSISTRFSRLRLYFAPEPGAR